MSDLLLMRGGGLRSLLSTPGLVACYLPYLQVAQSLTGQTLLDYSGRGNHATLGSNATAVDTADPTWTTNALSFDGGDYCVGPTSALSLPSTTVFVIAKTGLTSTMPLFNRGGDDRYSVNYKNGKVGVVRTGTVSVSQYTVSAVAPINSWHCVGARVYASGADTDIAVFVDGVAQTMETLDDLYSGQASLTTGLGKNFRNFFNGEMALFCGVSRAMGDVEMARLSYNLKSLMASQGVTIA